MICWHYLYLELETNVLMYSNGTAYKSHLKKTAKKEPKKTQQTCGWPARFCVLTILCTHWYNEWNVSHVCFRILFWERKLIFVFIVLKSVDCGEFLLYIDTTANGLNETYCGTGQVCESAFFFLFLFFSVIKLCSIIILYAWFVTCSALFSILFARGKSLNKRKEV